MPNIYFQVLKHHAEAIQRMYGVKWVPRPHHFKMCKSLFESEVEGFEPYEVKDIVERLEAYYRDDWWKNTRHDFANFVKHFDKFVEVKEQKSVRKSTRWCPECQTAHSINEPCVPKRDMAVLTQLAQSKRIA